MAHFGKYLYTRSARCLVAQELQVVLDPLPDTCNHVRRLQVIVPSGEPLYGVIDPTEDDIFSGKNFDFPPLLPGQTVEFLLAPSQSFAMCVHSGVAVTALIVEHFEPAS